MAKKQTAGVTYPEDNNKTIDDIEYISTGSIAVDFALGRKGVRCGIPRGLVSTIWGIEGGGKSTFVSSCIREAQKIGEVAVFDTELRLDPFYLNNMGVDVDALTIGQPDYANGVFGEQIADSITALAKSGRYAMIVLDSVAAWVPKNIAEGEASENNPGLHARMVSKFLMSTISHLKRTRTALLFTSQRRAKFGSMSFAGPSYEISGGNSLKFYSSVFARIDRLKNITPSSTSKEVIGIRSRITMQKNCGPAYTWAEFEITDSLGVDTAIEVFELGKPFDIAYNKGAWYYYVDENGEEIRAGQGRTNAVQFLRGNPELLESLRNRIVVAMSEKYAPQESEIEGDENVESD